MVLDTLEFLNENSLRAYPIRETLNRTSVDGIYVLPDQFIVDLNLAATTSASTRYFFSQITNSGNSISVTLSDDSLVPVGVFEIPDNHVQGAAVELIPSLNYPFAYGKLVVWDVSSALVQPIGTFSFTINSTEVEMRCVVPSLSAVRRISFTDLVGITHTVSGDITLEAGTNIRLTYNELTNTIIIDAGNGLGLNTECPDSQRPILTINGIPPDDAGNFDIAFSGCVLITPGFGGFSINDTCTKSCVSCEEIEQLTDRLVQLESDALQFRNRYQELESAFANYQSSIVTCGVPSTNPFS